MVSTYTLTHSWAELHSTPLIETFDFQLARKTKQHFSFPRSSFQKKSLPLQLCSHSLGFASPIRFSSDFYRSLVRLELTVLSFMLANTPSGRSTPPVHSYPSHSGSSPPRTLLGFDHHQLAPQYYHSLSLQASQHPHFPPTINNNLLHMTAAATALPGTSNNHSFDVNSPAPGSQNHKRPVGLTLANPNNAHGFSHYPVSAPSSSAPLPPGPPNHSPLSAPLRALLLPPPSATIPLSHSASAMPILNQASQPQNHPRARQPTAQPGSAHMQGRANDTQPHGRADSPSAPSHPRQAVYIGTPRRLKHTQWQDWIWIPNFPGLGFAVQPNSASQAKNGTQANLGSKPLSDRSHSVFQYLPQGLFEVARTFVASGVELDLVDGRDGLSASQPGSKPSNTHREDALKDRSMAGSNLLSTNDGANPANPKGGNAASELLPSERSMSASGSSISNASHYGFNHTDSNRSSNETPGQSSPSSDPATNPSNNTNGPNGVHTSPHTSASSRSSPLDSHTLRENLPKPKLAMDTDQGFLFEWWSIFWAVFRAKTGRAPAQSKSAQVYAQTVAAASLGMPNEPGGLTKARREALGILAVQNPTTPYSAPQQEPGNAPGARGSPHSLQGKQAQLNEQARAAQLNRLHQQQQLQRAEVARQRQQHQAPAQAQPVAQQQQEIALRAQEAQLRQPQHMHQIHPAHHDQFAHQRQMSMNARRPGMLANMSSEQAHAMMPPPPIQHGSPLNPHQQSYRPSRPSRAGTTHVSSPFASSQVQPQRQPSRASNHASSPAMQAHPRTPSASHASTPQASAASSHTRASPAVSNGDQDRKKRRLNDPIYNPTYKQSIHAKQRQAMSNAGGSNGQKGNNVSSPIKEAGSKPDENAMPPPSSRNAATQPSTPQSSASANKTTESTPLPTIVAPSPNINQPLRPASRNDQNSLSGGTSGNMCSVNDPGTATLPSSQPMIGRTMSNNDTEAKPNSSSDIQHGNEATESSGGVEHTNDKSMFMTEAVSKSHDKPGGLWSMDSNGNGQQHSNMSNGGNIQSNISPQANTGTQGMNSHELTMANNNAMDQLFGTESISFDLDASLFDAFINYDHNASARTIKAVGPIDFGRDCPGTSSSVDHSMLSLVGPILILSQTKQLDMVLPFLPISLILSNFHPLGLDSEFNDTVHHIKVS
ncbi:hypothetical protein PSHT_04590 [Puccinia striiformis]|uniref:Uncharacterized protein n=1 Tax=Puccinia striiformis TaxID=27350 RepID=A0A2S4WCQ8_9BASI|nr:hypothetical protein PSHT_04590 [Puccinia striiformis]